MERLLEDCDFVLDVRIIARAIDQRRLRQARDDWIMAQRWSYGVTDHSTHKPLACVVFLKKRTCAAHDRDTAGVICDTQNRRRRSGCGSMKFKPGKPRAARS